MDSKNLTLSSEKKGLWISLAVLAVGACSALVPVRLSCEIGPTRHTLAAVVPGLVYTLETHTAEGPYSSFVGATTFWEIMRLLHEEKKSTTLVFGGLYRFKVEYLWKSEQISGPSSYPNFSRIGKIMLDNSRESSR